MRAHEFQNVKQPAINRELREAPISNVDDDNNSPWGLTPYNKSVDYRGLRVAMKPSKFLALALPLEPGAVNPNVARHIEADGFIASPFLVIRLPATWFQAEPDFLRGATVVEHEGRNRMRAWQKKYGDEPVEVHLFFRDDIKRRDITERMIRELRRGMHDEAKSSYVTNTFERVIT